MADRDEAQAARWEAIQQRVGVALRDIRRARLSQARLSGELESLGFHVTQSMICRYEQGMRATPLSLERLVGWALCCDSLASATFHRVLRLAGYYLPWGDKDLKSFDRLLSHYRRLSPVDQMVLRRRLLWHILGIQEEADG